MAPLSDLTELLRHMAPHRHPGVYVFASVPAGAALQALDPVATLREDEGLSVVVTEEAAQAAGLTVLFRAAWITLRVHSDLQSVGLTATFSTALGREHISCNVVAGAHHDHLFVPVDDADRAMAVLARLQAGAAAAAAPTLAINPDPAPPQCGGAA